MSMSTSALTPRDPQHAERVRESFTRQGAMATLGATLAELEPGRVVITLPWAQALTQQHGFLHAGMVSTALDSACGYAAMSLMPADASVLTIEFKVNLLAPAQGESFRMVGQVIKAGRSVSVAEGHAYARREGQPDKLIATMSCTLMSIVGRENVRD
jgi:uncharacterized protein (TIGR00369 family)